MVQQTLTGALFADDTEERERLAGILHTLGVMLSFTGRLADAATHDCNGVDLRIVVADAATPTGIAAILALSSAAQAPVCLFYPAFALNGVLLACSSGVSGHALLSTAPHELAAGLQVVVRGGLFFCPTIWAAFAQSYLHTMQNLTLRDVQLLTLVANGETNRLIAETLAVSEKLVERRVQQLCTHIGVRNRTELAAWWGRRMAHAPTEARQVAYGA